MLVCSLVHEGKCSLSLSRIRVVDDLTQPFPSDIAIKQCRQCVEPLCIDACPVEALHIDTENGNVRTIDEEKCTGCMECIDACPFTPSMVMFNHEKDVAMKCDLCSDTPYWKEKGGPSGRQACVEICPMSAIAFTTEVPTQEGDRGYEVDLRQDIPENPMMGGH
jgi:protein NrfC